MSSITTDRIYLGIAERLMERIASGELRPGNRIPSVRECAMVEGVTPNTVANAHAFLRDMGVIRPERGMGSVVEASGAEMCRTFIRERFVRDELPVLKRRIRLLGMPHEELLRLLDGPCNAGGK
ncbi:GntR family transcriptional regulator [Salidesulfovibrio onnuriiensis]|uniref:GntR family transcriptional regulator n=1 Tax=Salidesulfovibrio onnuriiensis TaxID=2583823 RepID=UPI0011CBE8AD|nr:GntR family transcriptional regulator [Salidesulfovibrio onnuriiensis]